MVNMEHLFKTLDIEQMDILKQQIGRFNALSKEERKIIEIDDEIMLPAGTLIHGTPCRLESLSSISRSGILTGQSVGIEEDGETFFCADFHRVDSDTTLKDYNLMFPYNDGRCPFGRKGKGTIAFILYPDKRLTDLIAYDCYRDETKESDETKKFVNILGLPIKNKEKASSVLFGIPSNFINGIILGDRFIDEKTVAFIMATFPGTFITRNSGEVIYKNGDTLEIVKLRIKSIQRLIALEQKDEELKFQQQAQSRQNAEIDKIWRAIAQLPIDSIAKICEKLFPKQGDPNSLAQNLLSRYNSGSEETKTI